MTLLMCEGFEGIDKNSIKKIFEHNSSYPSQVTTYTGRLGVGKALGYPGGSTTDCNFYLDGTRLGLPPFSAYILGFAFKITAGGLSSINGFWVDDYWGNKFYIDITSSYIRANNDGVYNDYPLTYGNWYYVEFKFKPHNTEGYSIVRVNNSVLYSFSGDTIKSSNAGDYLGFRINWDYNCHWQMDDLYWLLIDDVGLTDFLGNCRVDTLLPNGAGTYSQMTPSTGNNYECVDDDPWDDSDYVESDTDGEKDTYTFPDVIEDIEDENILAVAIDNVAKRTVGINNVELVNVCRSNGSDYYGSNNVPLYDVSNGIKKTCFETDPDDDESWTKAKINACEFGVELSKTL